MTSRIRSVLIQAASFLLGGGLLYLALRNVDFAKVGTALQQAQYLWLLPLGIVTLLSHLLRAWRWKLLLDALPHTPGSAPRVKPVSVKIAFYSVMIGYLVNYAAPRLGELTRAVNMSTQEHLPLSRVIGTVVTDRILDVSVLILSMASVVLLFLDRVDALHNLFIQPVQDRIDGLTAGWVIGGLAGLALVIVGLAVYQQVLKRRSSSLGHLWETRLYEPLVSFKLGLLSVFKSPSKIAILLMTAGIWACYLLMTYLPLIMFGLIDAYGLSLLDTWTILIAGAVGNSLPTPGGMGPYHYFTIETMVDLFGVARSGATAFAVFAHAAQLILYAIVAFICIALQGSSFSSLWQITRKAQEKAA